MISVINQVINVKPVRPGSKEDLFPGKSVANTPGNKAVVYLKVNPLNGDLPTSGTDVMIIGLNPVKGRIINSKSSFFSGQSLEIFVNQLLKDPIENSVQKIFYEGGGILALSDNRNTTLWEEQEKIYRSLAHFIISDDYPSLLDIGKKAYILDPLPNSGNTHCHLSGKMTYNKDYWPPTSAQNEPLHHLATISCRSASEALKEYCNCYLHENLSFYIDSLHTDQGWPVNGKQSSVQNYHEATTTEGIHPEDQGTEISMRQFYSIPEPDHSVILALDMNNEDLTRYKALFNTYHASIGIGTKRRVQFLGYPQDGINCVAFEAESLHHNKPFSSIHYLDATKWQLLFQISSELYHFPFFDTFGKASIFYMIKKIDLKDGNFSRIQVVVQNS